MNIEQQLTADVRAAIKALYGQEVPDNLLQLQKTRKRHRKSDNIFRKTLMLWLPSMW